MTGIGHSRFLSREDLQQAFVDPATESKRKTSIDVSASYDLTNVIRNKLVESEGNRIAKAFYDPIVRKELDQKVKQLLLDLKIDLKGMDLSDMSKELVDEIAGSGPIEALLENDQVNEIMINNYNEVYVDQAGIGNVLTKVRFNSEEHLMNVARKMLNIAGETVTTAQPFVNARLPGMRLNVVIPPISLKGTTVTIRRYSNRGLKVDEVLSSGLMSKEMLDMLKIAIEYKANIFVIGGTGSGKTTLIKLLAGFIPDEERVITIEDDEELRLYELYPNKHIVPLECRATNKEETTVTITKLVRNGLRMFPSRMIIGEVRGEEAYDLLESMNTGHDGSIASGHANSATQAGERLISMVQRKPGLNMTPSEIGKSIAEGFNLFVYQKRISDYSRKTMQITEITGYENGGFVMNELYKFQLEGNEELDSNGKVKGSHVSVNPYFSEGFIKSLINNGAPISKIEKWIRKE